MNPRDWHPFVLFAVLLLIGWLITAAIVFWVLP